MNFEQRPSVIKKIFEREKNSENPVNAADK
jgi:hypothetical protein